MVDCAEPSAPGWDADRHLSRWGLDPHEVLAGDGGGSSLLRTGLRVEFPVIRELTGKILQI